MGRARRIELVDEDVDLGGGLRARIARPREPGRLLDDAVADGADDAPYWAELWPSARALAAQLASSDLVGVRAVELGCGLALPSVAAAMRGADVLVVDNDADAVLVARSNARRAGNRLRGLVLDLHAAPQELVEEGPFDLVFAADVLYVEALATALSTLIPLLTAPGGRALVAYPWPGQADELAGALERAGMAVLLRELPVPGFPRARAVGLLEASRGMPRIIG